MQQSDGGTDKVLAYLSDNPCSTNGDICKALGMEQQMVMGYIATLIYKDKVCKAGRTSGRAGGKALYSQIINWSSIRLTQRTGGDFSYVYANKPVVGQEFRMNR